MKRGKGKGKWRQGKVGNAGYGKLLEGRKVEVEVGVKREEEWGKR